MYPYKRRKKGNPAKFFLNFTFMGCIKVELFSEMCYNKNVFQCRFTALKRACTPSDAYRSEIVPKIDPPDMRDPAHYDEI